MKKPAQAGFFMPAIWRFSLQPLMLFSLAHALPDQPVFSAIPPLVSRVASRRVILESYFLSLFSFFYFIIKKTVTTLANRNIAHSKTNKRNPDVRFDN
ncbi:hypothetical protein [Citrobacter freundii]|uniref:hypothetical protein n=1 Tax=Citrobacter freundii TaxID=546 RepID=UPI00107191D3|nr:hypothetical protein [Citrobacter freundii]QIH67624.1 hypothetical protein G4551_03635 [Citrobacter freundii ATCC 8090 = MTCC 1658 = NBRC 12681]WOY55755.1 hypothetical protein R6I13_03645 [Citrobacter freundii]WOY60723.1 hypothetical protein R6I17_05785 [Citrobacter freundii]WPZ49022.1 hypothetical protein R6I57_03645 [Citrobacter freundii]